MDPVRCNERPQEKVDGIRNQVRYDDPFRKFQSLGTSVAKPVSMYKQSVLQSILLMEKSWWTKIFFNNVGLVLDMKNFSM